MNPTTLERFKSVGRILVYIVLVIFLIRNVLDVYEQVTGANKQVAHTQSTTSNEVPVTAESVAKVFLSNWYYVGPDKEEGDTRLSRLQPYVTPDLYNYISHFNDLSVQSASTDGVQQQPTQQDQTTQTDTSDESLQLSAKEVDIWKLSWVDQKKGTAKAIARMLTSDNKTLFLSVPVQKSGTTWQVSALPSLIAKPAGSGEAEDKPDIDLGSEKQTIMNQLDSFFSSWLSGNANATTVFMSNHKPLPATDWLTDLHAQYKNVQDVTVISQGKQLKVKVEIMVQDEHNVSMLLDYFMTLEKKNDTWTIVSID